MPLNLSDELEKTESSEKISNLLLGIENNKRLRENVHGVERVLKTLSPYKSSEDVDRRELKHSLEVAKNILKQSIHHRKGEIEYIHKQREEGFVPNTPNNNFDLSDLDKEEEHLNGLHSEIEEIEAYKREIESIHRELVEYQG